jgi:hypothetical protein
VVEPSLLVSVTPVAARPDRLNSPPAPAVRDETAPSARLVTPGPRPVAPPVTSGVDAAAYTAAIGLAGVAAWFSISGMVTLFPGSPQSVVTMAAVMEGSKLVTVAFLAARWSVTPWLSRIVFMVFIAGLAAINASGVFSQLVSAHVGERGAAQTVVEMQDAEVAGKIEVAAGRVGDLDRRIGQIDSAIEEAAKHGKAAAALTAIDGRRKARAGLAVERDQAAATLAALKVERAGVASKARQRQAEAAPLLYVAETIGIAGDSERAIRWLIALMVLCCDPLAIALTAAAAAAAAAQRGRAA